MERAIRIASIDDPRVAVYRNQKDAWLRVQNARREPIGPLPGGTGLLRPTSAEHHPASPSGGAGHEDEIDAGPGRGGLFMAEGELVVRQLLRAAQEGRGFRLRSLLISDARLATMGDALARLDERTPIYLAEGPLLAGIVGFALHRGVLACGERAGPGEPDAWTADRLRAERRLIVVLEDLANHDNVGGIFRNIGALAGAAAAGVLLSPRCCDPLYRKALRVSVGQALHVPFAVAADWPGELARLAEAGFETLALTPAPDAVPIAEVAPSSDGGRPLALVLGAEGPGLTPGAMSSCARRVRIPVRAEADSVNVATACAIALHALWRVNES